MLGRIFIVGILVVGLVSGAYATVYDLADGIYGLGEGAYGSTQTQTGGPAGVWWYSYIDGSVPIDGTYTTMTYSWNGTATGGTGWSRGMQYNSPLGEIIYAVDDANNLPYVSPPAPEDWTGVAMAGYYPGYYSPVIEWIAPEDGIVDIALTVAMVDAGGANRESSDGMNAHVELYNGATVTPLATPILVDFDTTGSFNITGVTVSAGDRVQLRYDPNVHGVYDAGIAWQGTIDLIPEPATMSLLAAGGIAVLLKKRR